ncbi:MAG: hypothetical protein KAJ19_22020, partial [Gammaproteobacteria bacterium]|nr:hypothetical protein [Gammaproteobacteria bacterium]
KVKKRKLTDELQFLVDRLKEVVPSVEPNVIVAAAQKKSGMRELAETIDSLLSGQGVESPRWAFTVSS